VCPSCSKDFDLRGNISRIWTPSATALVAFLCYTLVERQKLTVSKAFTALSLFSYLQGPMAALPGQVEALIKGEVIPTDHCETY
jgi:hypothetical protein